MQTMIYRRPNYNFFFLVTLLFVDRSCVSFSRQSDLGFEQVYADSQALTNKKLLKSFLGHQHKQGNFEKEIIFSDNKLYSIDSDKKIIIKSDSENLEKTNFNFSFDFSWHLDNVKIFGAGQYTDHLKQLYKVYCPEKFNLTHHYELVEKIKQKMFDYGYFEIEINDNFELNFAKKSVLVKLEIKLNKPSFVERIDVQVVGAIDPKIQQIKPKILKLCKNFVWNKRYELGLMNLCQTKIQDLLLFNGIKNVVVDTQYDQSKKTLFLYLNSKDDFLTVFNCAKIFLSDSEYKLEEGILDELVKRDCLSKGYRQATLNLSDEEVYSFFPSDPVLLKSVRFEQLDDKDFDVEISLPKIEQQIFNKNILDQVVKDLKNEYLRVGFWNCKIDPKIEEINTQANAVNVCFKITKGPRYLIDTCVATHFTESENKRIQSIVAGIVKLKPGTVANYFAIERIKNQILERLKEEGFLKSKVDIEIKNSSESEHAIFWIDIFFRVDPGKKAKFGEILLSNQTKVPTKKIRKKLSFASGDDWDLHKIKASIKKIESMHLFKNVRFSSVPQLEDTDDLTIPIRLTVTPDKPREFRAHVGGSVFGVGLKREMDQVDFSCHLGAQYAVKNPFMLADRVELGANITQDKQTADLIYRCFEPFELPLESKLKFFVGRSGLKDGFAFKQKTIRDSVTRVGTSLSCNFEYERFGVLQLCNGFEGICPPALQRKNPANWTGYYVLGSAYNLDKIYSSWFNRFGNTLSLSAQLVFPLRREGVFLHSQLKDSIFVPVGSNACVAFEISLENNQAFGGATYLECMEKNRQELIKKNTVFFPSLTDRHTPPDVDNLAWEALESGKNRAFALMAEFRTKILGSLAAVAFQGIRFVEKIGVLHTSGLGVRYMTPFGMICMDLGAKWNFNKSFKDTCSWRVSLGQAF